MNERDLREAREQKAVHQGLLARERRSLADLLLAIGEFEERGLFRALGHATAFDYVHRGLGLSRGMAHYRLVGARLVRKFPEVEEPIREGKLCVTTVIELARVVTEENRREVLPRFFGLSREEARELAAEIDPAKVVPRRTVVTSQATVPAPLPRVVAGVAALVPAATVPDALAPKTVVGSSTIELETTPSGPAAPEPRTTVEPLTGAESRLHVTVSREFLTLLRKAKAGESHRNPGATDEEVLRLGLEALIEKQGKRKASVPAKVKREVEKRDGGKCTWQLADGGTCGATVKLEIDHIHPRGKGGASTVENCRILCRSHNLEAARQVYGDDFIDLFTRGKSGGKGSAAREAIAEYGPPPARLQPAGRTRAANSPAGRVFRTSPRVTHPRRAVMTA